MLCRLDSPCQKFSLPGPLQPTLFEDPGDVYTPKHCSRVEAEGPSGSMASVNLQRSDRTDACAWNLDTKGPLKLRVRGFCHFWLSYTPTIKVCWGAWAARHTRCYDEQ